MRRAELFGTTALRWTIAIAALIALSIAIMAGFFYWQTVGRLRQQLDESLLSDVHFFSLEAPDTLAARMTATLASDPRHRKAYGLFDASRHRLAGNLPALPSPLPAPGGVAVLDVETERGNRLERSTVRAVAERLDNGGVLFLGRVADELAVVSATISRALMLAIAPTVLLAVVGGLLVSKGALRRVEAVRRACLEIMDGRLERRLPVRGTHDEFDRLSEIVNRMLDDIERLLGEARSAGDAVAHDVRTPLTRLRVRLERALRSDLAPAKSAEVFEKAIRDIDGLLATVTAILRVSEVEQGRRRKAFAVLDLEDIVEAVGELYGPIAEEKGLAFALQRMAVPDVFGDADLMFEAVANLVDNAIKFTPPGGRVALALARGATGPTVTVSDTGPGIPAADRDAVLRRFHRGDHSRSAPGTGLGLSLVAAIARLHGFTLSLGDSPGGGCLATIATQAMPAGSVAKGGQLALATQAPGL